VLGGGLAGLTAAHLLARQGFSVVVLEKKQYPQHRVCGEYLSREIDPLAERLGLDLPALGAVGVGRLEVTSSSGAVAAAALPLGGWGLSRYRLDEALAQSARRAGAQVWEKTPVMGVQRAGDGWRLQTPAGSVAAQHVVGTFGKRSNLDRELGRDFLRRRSPFVAVKHHLLAPDYPEDQIALHNFPGGYAGFSRVEDGRFCFCYLCRRAVFKRAGGVDALERDVLSQNPALRRLLAHSRRAWTRPLVINEVSFAYKPLFEQGVWMTGDAAGMIAPLCGNGMAMAMTGGLLMAYHLGQVLRGERSAEGARSDYRRSWRRLFSTRLALGRRLQPVFGSRLPTELLVRTFAGRPAWTAGLAALTHGRPEQHQPWLDRLAPAPQPFSRPFF
jgi:flavin-dependent dehydrogenase